MRRSGVGLSGCVTLGGEIGDVLLLRDLWSDASEMEGVELSGGGLTSSVNNPVRLFW